MPLKRKGWVPQALPNLAHGASLLKNKYSWGIVTCLPIYYPAAIILHLSGLGSYSRIDLLASVRSNVTPRFCSGLPAR